MKAFFSLLLLALLSTCAPATESSATAENTSAPAAYEDLSPAEFAERIGGEGTVLIDVRTPGEIANGKIEGALEMDYRGAGFAEQLQQLDPDKTYLIYCASGGRSGNTCEMLNEAGFAKVYNLKGGYSAWKQ